MQPIEQTETMAVIKRGPHELEHLTQLNQINSPLLRLPAELRNKIYEYALGDARVFILPRAFREYKKKI
ncbi:hypothetical protein BDW02DRAFT_597700 [Decorospora gaudefroyi]|uniref:Uncharacterized protein n=1 Tax=Decorospora gaudefroyi TaxID=184978 RepID=A0A6A5KHJ3_9PLEO|nr:hypothetical protein BDW02DRAFT_597700 [Decorospora gaudefroyi]